MFKRRQARQRAESRKVEGIELRNSARWEGRFIPSWRRQHFGRR